MQFMEIYFLNLKQMLKYITNVEENTFLKIKYILPKYKKYLF